MELSTSVQRGLQAAGSSALSDQVFRELARQAVEDSIAPADTTDLKTQSGEDQAVLKEAHASLMTLTLEAARTDSDSAIISTALEECKFAPDRIQVFTTIYSENKAKIRASLRRTQAQKKDVLYLGLVVFIVTTEVILYRVGTTLPHVVDVDWRLDYYIKSNHLERVNKPVYLIELKTEQGTEQSNIQFTCTQEELQDLVSKLKDASKSLEKYSHKQ